MLLSIKERILCKTSFQVGMDLEKVQKQGRDERTQEAYPTFAMYFCRCKVVFLRSFIVPCLWLPCVNSIRFPNKVWLIVCCSVVLPRLVLTDGTNLQPPGHWISARNTFWNHTTSSSKWLVVVSVNGCPVRIYLCTNSKKVLMGCHQTVH